MSGTHDGTSLPHMRRQALLGARDYASAIDQVIACALGQIRVFDRSLGRDFNTSLRFDALRDFLLAERTRRVRIVLHDASRLREECPRLVALLRQVGHALAIHRTLSAARGVYDPFCIADGSHYARRFHFDNPRGTLVFDDPEGSAELARRFDEIWEVSQPAISATTLGL